MNSRDIEMKEFSKLTVLVATIALLVTSQAFSEEPNAPKSDETEESNVEAVTEDSANAAKERDYDTYVSVGFSTFQEEISSAIGSGESFRLAFGHQLKKWFGLEWFEERTPVLETKSILADLSQEFDESILNYSISSQGNKLGGILAKFSYEHNEKYTFVAKVGFAE